jgi:anti-sigma factor RsiW
MSCAETKVLLHALLDNELDAGHASELETHVAICPGCAAELRVHRIMQEAISAADLRFTAPMSLRRRIEAALPTAPARTTSRRALLKGFVMGSAVSTAMAASLVVGVIRTDHDQQVLGDVVAAHVRSLQGEHLTDVQTSDQHTVKPWFNGKLDLAPPVLDLTAQGFTLIGGRLDYVDEKTAAAIVYRRRKHVINLFVTQAPDSQYHPAQLNTVQGYNILNWRARGLEFFAISDLNPEELKEFGDKFTTGFNAGRT